MNDDHFILNKENYLKLKENIYKIFDVFWDISIITVINIGKKKHTYNIKLMNEFISKALEHSESILASHKEMKSQVYKDL